MSSARKNLVFAVVVGILVVGLLGWVASAVWRTVQHDRERQATPSTPVSERIPGATSLEITGVNSGGAGSRTQTLITFGDQGTDAPDETARALGEQMVNRQEWVLTREDSRMVVSSVRPDERVSAWWLRGARAVHEADPDASLDCRYPQNRLECELTGASPAAVDALLAVPFEPLQGWLEEMPESWKQTSGFALTAGERHWASIDDLQAAV